MDMTGRVTIAELIGHAQHASPRADAPAAAPI
jgi:hypothetical protein